MIAEDRLRLEAARNRHADPDRQWAVNALLALPTPHLVTTVGAPPQLRAVVCVHDPDGIPVWQSRRNKTRGRSGAFAKRSPHMPPPSRHGDRRVTKAEVATPERRVTRHGRHLPDSGPSALSLPSCEPEDRGDEERMSHMTVKMLRMPTPQRQARRWVAATALTLGTLAGGLTMATGAPSAGAAVSIGGAACGFHVGAPFETHATSSAAFEFPIYPADPHQTCQVTVVARASLLPAAGGSYSNVSGNSSTTTLNLGFSGGSLPLGVLWTWRPDCADPSSAGCDRADHRRPVLLSRHVDGARVLLPGPRRVLEHLVRRCGGHPA